MIFQNQWNFRLCGVFLIDSHFMVDGSKFLSGSMSALSCMINLELSHVNILSKVDLLSPEAKKQLDSYLEPDTLTLLTSGGSQSRSAFEDKYHSLSEALARVLDDYSLVKYFPLDINDEENIGDLLITIDNVLQVQSLLQIFLSKLNKYLEPGIDLGSLLVRVITNRRGGQSSLICPPAKSMFLKRKIIQTKCVGDQT